MGFVITQTVDLNDPKRIEQISGMIAYYGDDSAHTWNVTVNNADTFLTGKTANALIILPSGVKYMLPATIADNVVSVTLDAAAYSEQGAVSAFLQITNTDGDLNVTIAVMRYIVSECANGTVHVPTDIILPIKTLTEKYQTLLDQYGSLAELDTDSINKLLAGIIVDTDNKTVSSASGYTIVPDSEYEAWSTDAVACGEWVDGSTVYRKTYIVSAVSNVTSVTDTVVAESVLTALGINLVTRIDGIAMQNNGVVNQIPAYYSSENYKEAFINSSGSLVYRHRDSSTSNKNDVYITIWYTVS